MRSQFIWFFLVYKIWNYYYSTIMRTNIYKFKLRWEILNQYIFWRLDTWPFYIWFIVEIIGHHFDNWHWFQYHGKTDWEHLGYLFQVTNVWQSLIFEAICCIKRDQTRLWFEIIFSGYVYTNRESWPWTGSRDRASGRIRLPDTNMVSKEVSKWLW